MAKTRSQNVKAIQKSNLNKRSAIHKNDSMKRAKNVTVQLSRINLSDFDRKTVAHCSIQLARKDFKTHGEFWKIHLKKICSLHGIFNSHLLLWLWILFTGEQSARRIVRMSTK